MILQHDSKVYTPLSRNGYLPYFKILFQNGCLGYLAPGAQPS